MASHGKRPGDPKTILQGKLSVVQSALVYAFMSTVPRFGINLTKKTTKKTTTTGEQLKRPEFYSHNLNSMP